MHVDGLHQKKFRPGDSRLKRGEHQSRTKPRPRVRAGSQPISLSRRMLAGSFAKLTVLQRTAMFLFVVCVARDDGSWCCWALCMPAPEAFSRRRVKATDTRTKPRPRIRACSQLLSLSRRLMCVVCDQGGLCCRVLCVRVSDAFSGHCVEAADTRTDIRTHTRPRFRACSQTLLLSCRLVMLQRTAIVSLVICVTSDGD